MGALPYKTNRNYMRREPYRANKDIIAVLRVCVAQLFTFIGEIWNGKTRFILYRFEIYQKSFKCR